MRLGAFCCRCLTTSQRSIRFALRWAALRKTCRLHATCRNRLWRLLRPARALRQTLESPLSSRQTPLAVVRLLLKSQLSKRQLRQLRLSRRQRQLLVEKPVVEAPAEPAAPDPRPATIAEVQSTPIAPVATPVVESPVAPAAPATPKAPVAQVVETVVVEKPVVEVPVATDSSPATVAAVPATPTAPVAPDSRPATVATVQVTPASPVATPAVESPAAPVATPVVESPVASAAPDSRPVTVAEVSASPAAPIAKSPVASSPVAPVVEAPVAKSEVAAARPVVAEKRTAAPEEVVVIDLSQESARAASPLREAPFVAAAQQEISASTASARTEAIVEVVSNVAEAIAGQILVTPSLVRGEGQMIVRLKPEVLDGSEIRLSSESGTLAVEVVPSTPNAAKLATEAMPRLETALAEHVSAFRKISVSVRKGKGNEIV